MGAQISRVSAPSSPATNHTLISTEYGLGEATSSVSASLRPHRNWVPAGMRSR